ncbi:MAG: hypothetical protein ACRC3Y_00860 [Romboutsia sp.]|uniref:hypothetical protein n=1 Tax=Romboutsia sp. TaxID=1965302 RepID=UPI003F326025
MIITNAVFCIDSITHTDSNIFKEYDLCDAINIQKENPKINKIVEYLLYPNIKKVDFFNNQDKLGNIYSENSLVNSNKLIIELDIKERAVYTTKTKSEYVYTHNINTIKTLSIEIPNKIKEKSTYELFKSSRLQINPHVENIHIRKIDDMNIYRTMLLLLEAKFFV